MNLPIFSRAKSSTAPLRPYRATLVMLALAGCCLGLLSLYFSAGEYGLRLFLYYLTQPLVLVLNLLPFVVMILLFYCLFNRAWIAFFATGGLCLLYSWAQYWKLMARNDPVYAEDLVIFSEALQMSGNYIEVTWQIVLSAVLVILGTLFLAIFFRTRAPRPASRWKMAAVLIGLCCLLYPTVYSLKPVYKFLNDWPQINKWFATNQYISRGGIYPFLYSIQTAVPTVPDGYEKNEAQSILNEYETDDIPEDQKVSVICVMYEAFADLTTCTDRITGPDPYESFHTLQSESYNGTLVVNTFAGGTINTERSVLTGFSELTNFRRPSWSYARYFADQGYTINGAHPGYEGFYNRRNVNENLGISDYRFFEDCYGLLSDTILMDSQFLPDVAEYCKQQMADGPVFSFNVTYQNHGPYETATCYSPVEYVSRDGLADYDYNIINNYLCGVQSTSDQMLAMADSFRDYDEPVILVFFGDRKPWLGDQSTTYSALGIDIESETDESFYNYYSTEYTIWANEAAKAVLGNDFQGTGPTISPCYLMNVLFDQCGWEGPSYLKLSSETMARLPIIHLTERCQVNGVMTDDANLSAEDTALLNRMRKAQYYLAQHSGGILPE